MNVTKRLPQSPIVNPSGCPVQLGASPALSENNLEKIRTEAHKMKGTAGNFGATAIYEIAKKIQENHENIDAVGTLIERLATLIAKTRSALTNYLGLK